MRYPKHNNPIRERIFSMKDEMKDLGKEIRAVKNILSNNFSKGILEEDELYRYRTYQIMLNNLRDKFRCMHLIYGFVRDKSYRSMESKTHKKINWMHVAFWASHYGLSSFIDLEKAIKECAQNV